MYRTGYSTGDDGPVKLLFMVLRGEGGDWRCARQLHHRAVFPDSGIIPSAAAPVGAAIQSKGTCSSIPKP